MDVHNEARKVNTVKKKQKEQPLNLRDWINLQKNWCLKMWPTNMVNSQTLLWTIKRARFIVLALRDPLLLGMMRENKIDPPIHTESEQPLWSSSS